MLEKWLSKSTQVCHNGIIDKSCKSGCILFPNSWKSLIKTVTLQLLKPLAKHSFIENKACKLDDVEIYPKKAKEEWNTLNYENSSRVQDLILKFYFILEYLNLWKSFNGDLSFNWLHLYSIVKWSEIMKIYDLLSSKFDKTFKRTTDEFIFISFIL